eukprot:6331246-Amphidinium_carterae.1
MWEDAPCLHLDHLVRLDRAVILSHSNYLCFLDSEYGPTASPQDAAKALLFICSLDNFQDVVLLWYGDGVDVRQL